MVYTLSDYMDYLIIINMELSDLRDINGNGCMSFKEIYYLSKRWDDYGFMSTQFTLTLSYKIRQYQKYLDTKKNKAEACKYIWCGLKVIFYIDPCSAMLEFLIDDIRNILALGDKGFNEEFKKKRDNELLGYKDPDEHQAKLIREIKDLLNQA